MFDKVLNTPLGYYLRKKSPWLLLIFMLGPLINYSSHVTKLSRSLFFRIRCWFLRCEEVHLVVKMQALCPQSHFRLAIPWAFSKNCVFVQRNLKYFFHLAFFPHQLNVASQKWISSHRDCAWGLVLNSYTHLISTEIHKPNMNVYQTYLRFDFGTTAKCRCPWKFVELALR